ncbi:MAG: hypothetical protein NVS3B20_05240 [Polyangiales bacterium]
MTVRTIVATLSASSGFLPPWILLLPVALGCSSPSTGEGNTFAVSADSESMLDGSVDAALDHESPIDGAVDGAGDSSAAEVADSSAEKSEVPSVPPTCPATASALAYSAKTYDCGELIYQYNFHFASATACGCTKDCSTKLPDKMNCGCDAFVSPMNDGFVQLTTLRAEYAKRIAMKLCSPVSCPSVVCKPLGVASCVGGGAGTMGTCKGG